MFDDTPPQYLPLSTGIGYKSQHFQGLMDAPGPVKWLEIHAENYMGAGGRPIAQLCALADRFPISIHGVGLSIGGEKPLDRDHLARLRDLCEWVGPVSFSEHLAWSTHDTGFLNDLLPLPYTQATLTRVADHINEVQDTLDRRMLLENPSTYLAFAETEMEEVEFLSELAKRTGCGLLLDVNNVFVSATNQGYAPRDYIDAFPMEHVGELHLGGHDADEDDQGRTLLIDSHRAPVVDPVWDLYAHTIAVAGPRPTLIEWDSDVPPLAELIKEAARATAILAREGVPA